MRVVKRGDRDRPRQSPCAAPPQYRAPLLERQALPRNVRRERRLVVGALLLATVAVHAAIALYLFTR